MKKINYSAIAFIISVFLLAGCSSAETEEVSETVSVLETTVETTTEAAETTETSAETTTTELVTEISEPVSQYFTSYAAGPLSMECLTCEGEKGVWAHLINPFNELALFEAVGEGELEADTSEFTICFNVTGVSNEITAFCGVSAYSISGESVSVWDNNAYSKLTGEEYEFVISEDGYYEMIVPLNKLTGGIEAWDGLGHLEVLEIAFFGAEKMLGEGVYSEELTEGLEFEFLGIKSE